MRAFGESPPKYSLPEGQSNEDRHPRCLEGRLMDHLTEKQRADLLVQVLAAWLRQLAWDLRPIVDRAQNESSRVDASISAEDWKYYQDLCGAMERLLGLLDARGRR